MASPLVHTVIAAKTSAKTSARPDPMNRPRIPKWAPLETVMLVPVRGPTRASGITTSVPITVPTRFAVSDPTKSSPRTTPNQP